jgi:ankyrin repeat protein
MKWLKGYSEHLRESQEEGPEELGKRLIRVIDSEKTPDIEEVKALIGAGADLETRDIVSRTPLHWAAYRGHTESANTLIEAGADLEARDSGAWTPLHYAAANDHPEAAKALVEAGADLEARTRYGKTPLHYAAANDHTEAAKALIEAGADLEARTRYGKTSLHWAAYLGHTEAAKALIEAGADPLTGFGSIEEMKYFFSGDISWAPEEAIQRMKKRERARGAFGRF